MRRPAIKRDHGQDQQAEDELLPFVLQPDAQQERGENLQDKNADDSKAVAAIAAQQRRAANDHRRKRGEEIGVAYADERAA